MNYSRSGFGIYLATFFETSKEKWKGRKSYVCVWVKGGNK